MRINLSSWAKFEISKRLSFKLLLSTIEPRLVGVVNVIKVMSCTTFNGPRIKSTLRYRFSGISLKFSHAFFESSFGPEGIEIEVFLNCKNNAMTDQFFCHTNQKMLYHYSI